MLRKEGKLTSLVLFVTLVLASSVGADASAAEASAVIGAPVETLALNKALATGNFECRVIGIDPPDGTGVPIGFATIGLRSLLGVVSTGGRYLRMPT
jgi:hypothetical protein